MATNFYDVGVTIISKRGVFVMFFEGYNVKAYEDAIINQDGIFNYLKFPIGVYKTVIRQLDVAQRQCCLVVDKDGKFVTDKGVVYTGIIVPRTLKQAFSIGGSVSAWRNGYDGILYDNQGQQHKYKIQGSYVELS